MRSRRLGLWLFVFLFTAGEVTAQDQQRSRARWLDDRANRERVEDEGRMVASYWTSDPAPVTVSNPLTLISSKSFADYFGDYVLVGEVRNTSSSTLAFAKVTLQMGGAGGVSMGSDFTYVYGSQNGRLSSIGAFIDILPPNEVGFFKIWTSVPASSVQSTSLTSEGQSTGLSTVFGSLQLAGSVSLGSSFIGTSYSGTLRNAGPVAAFFSKIYLAGYGGGGSIEDVDFTYVDGTSITTCSGITTTTAIRPDAQAPFASFFLRTVTSIGRVALAWDETGISPRSQSYPAGGGTGSVNAINVCSLSGASNIPWVTVTGITDTGNQNGTVSYSVASNASVARTGTLTISEEMFTISQAAVGPALPVVSIDDRTVAEGASVNAAFRVFLSGASTSTVTVQYATANNTAVAGSDYSATSGTLTFTPGRTQQSVFVPIVSDTTAEGNESFFVNLSNPGGATLGTKSQGIGTITDPPPAAKSAMYRSYNKSTDYHFFTTDLASKNFAVGTLGFQDESSPIPFYVWNTQQTQTTPLFRMYNPNLGRHFYTASSGSRDFLMGIGALYEKEEGFVYPLATSPVPAGATELFLLYNNNSGTHLFTADAGQKSAILSLFRGVWVQHTSVAYVFASP